MDIILTNFSKKYDSELIFDNFNFTIEEHKITSILGNSGCGKTTLLNAISGLLSYDGAIENVPQEVSYVFQEQSLIPNLSVYDNLDYVLKHKIKDKYERTNIIIRALIKVGLLDYKDSYPNSLSNGMAQRISMARAFIYPSELILMDEPFSGLDVGTKSQLIKYFLNLWQEREKTVAFVTHTIEDAIEISDKIVVLGERPVKIIGEFNLPSNKIDRDTASFDVFEIRNKIYRLFKQGN